MSEGNRIFLHLLTASLWCLALFLSKVHEKANTKGLTSLGVFGGLIVLFALVSSLASGVETVSAWRRCSWFGRCFGLIMFIPALLFIALFLGWIERLPFDIRF